MSWSFTFWGGSMKYACYCCSFLYFVMFLQLYLLTPQCNVSLYGHKALHKVSVISCSFTFWGGSMKYPVNILILYSVSTALPINSTMLFLWAWSFALGYFLIFHILRFHEVLMLSHLLSFYIPFLKLYLLTLLSERYFNKKLKRKT